MGNWLASWVASWQASWQVIYYITEQLTRDFTGEFAVIFNLKLVVVLIPGGEGLQLHAVLPGLHGGCSSRGSSWSPGCWHQVKREPKLYFLTTYTEEASPGDPADLRDVAIRYRGNQRCTFWPPTQRRLLLGIQLTSGMWQSGKEGTNAVLPGLHGGCYSRGSSWPPGCGLQV